MKKLLQAAGVASLVLFGAVGCSTCCGDRTVAGSAPCANGQCATGTTTSHMAGPGVTGTATPTTMVTTPGRAPMMSVNQIPATGSMTPGTMMPAGNPALLPQN